MEDELDNFFDDLGLDNDKPSNSPKKDTESISKDIKNEVSVNVESVEPEEISVEPESLEEDKKVENDDSKKINDDETREISNVKMKELKEQLKDGLTDSDFTESRNQIDITENKNSKIFVKVEEGPVFEFQVEKDMIQWLKAKSSLKGVLYSLDNKEFSPILTHQIFKDVEEILNREKDGEMEVIPASEILNKKEIEKKSYSFKGLFVLSLLINLALIGYLVYSLRNQNNSYDKNTRDSKRIETVKKEMVKTEEKKKENIQKQQEKKNIDNTQKDNSIKTSENKVETPENKNKVKVSENKVKADNEVKNDTKKDNNTSNNSKNDEKSKEQVKKEENTQKQEPKKENTKAEAKKEENTQKQEPKIEKITLKQKRGYYRKARLAFKAKKFKEAKKLYLTLAYNFPKEAEPYGVLFQILKKEKDNKKYAGKFIKAYKSLIKKRKNKTVDKKLIEQLLLK